MQSLSTVMKSPNRLTTNNCMTSTVLIRGADIFHARSLMTPARVSDRSPCLLPSYHAYDISDENVKARGCYLFQGGVLVDFDSENASEEIVEYSDHIFVFIMP